MLTDIHYFFGSNSTSDEATIGNITSLSADVRHKSKSDYFWQEMNLKTKIAKGDSIFTGNKSSSEVTLDDGKLLKISQNSLVHFSTNKDQLVVDLAFGNVSASGLDKTLVISDCGQKYTIDTNQASFNLTKTEKCGSFNIQVKTGAVNVNKQKVSKVQTKIKKQKFTISEAFNKPEPLNVLLPQQQSLFKAVPEAVEAEPIIAEHSDLPETAESKPELPEIIETPSITEPVKTGLLAPEFLQKDRQVILKSTTQVKFSWKHIPEAEQYRIETSTNPEFTEPTVTVTPENNYEFKPTETGIFYFRLSAQAQKFENSPFSKAKIVKTVIPSIIVDQLKIEDAYKARSPADIGQSKKFPLKWNSIPTAKKYTIEVDTEKDFKSASKTIVSKPEGYLQVPQTGNYYFRVSAVDKANRQISSMPSLGEITYKKINQISGPLINSAYKSLSYYFQKEFGQFIWLRWKPLKASSKYRLEVSQDAEFKKLNYAYATADTQFLIKSKVPKGEYFWRVRSESEDPPSTWSEIAKITIHTK